MRIPPVDPWAERNRRALEALETLEWMLGLGPLPAFATRPRADYVRVERTAPPPVTKQPRIAAALSDDERRRRWAEYQRERRTDPAVRARESELSLARRGGPKGRRAPLTHEEHLARRRESQRLQRALETDEERERRLAYNRERVRAHRATVSREALREQWRRHQAESRARRAA